MTHEEVRELIPAYALDAVGGTERAALEDHVRTCDRCSAILIEHLEAAGLLAFTVEPQIPSKALRYKLMAEVSAKSETSNGPRPTPKKQRVRARGLVAVVALVVAAIVASLFLLPRGGVEDRLSPTAADILGDEETVGRPMFPTREIPEASGQMYDPRRGDRQLLIMRGLLDPRGRVYVLWVIVKDRAVKLGEFETDQNGTALVYVSGIPENNDGVLVTLEEDPETKVPQGLAILRSL